MRSAIGVALLVALTVGVPGCKKKPPPEPPAPPPQPVEIRLQVTSISPSTIPPDSPSKAKVFGSAFEDGATVVFSGPAEAAGTGVVLESSNALNVSVPPLSAGVYDVRVTNPSGESSTLRSGLTVRNLEVSCRNVTVHFDFDASSLRGDAKSTLDANMPCYQQLTGAVRIEGHADERGTTDYNIALGQRRSDAVKQYLVSNGVATGRVNTTSYGEERPVDPGSNESAWSKNRRAELTATE